MSSPATCPQGHYPYVSHFLQDIAGGEEETDATLLKKTKTAAFTCCDQKKSHSSSTFVPSCCNKLSTSIAILVGILWIYPQSKDRKENIVDVETVKARMEVEKLVAVARVSFSPCIDQSMTSRLPVFCFKSKYSVNTVHVFLLFCFISSQKSSSHPLHPSPWNRGIFVGPAGSCRRRSH